MNALSQIMSDADQDMSVSDDLGIPDPNGPDPQHLAKLQRWIASQNIAMSMDDSGNLNISDERLAEIGMLVKREYEVDDASRSEWLDKYRIWMDFALQKTTPKTYPWEKASNVLFPLMTTASVQFAARAYPAIVQNRNVVKGVTVGPDDKGIKRLKADRVGRYMSWQLLNEMEDWESDTDRMLHVLPVVGCVFRKTYYDPTFQRNVSAMVPADRVCINYHAQSFERAPRITEELYLYPFEIEEMIRAGIFVQADYVIGNPDSGDDNDAPVAFLEQHRRIDLDDDGYAEPYIVTIDKAAGRVARIVAAYDEDTVFWDRRQVRKIKPVSYYTKYGFIPNPDGGVYDIGFGHLLHPINEAINSTLNMMLDAGHLANVGGGFLGKGLSMSSGNVRFRPGEYKPVNITGQSLRDNIYQLQFPGPSPVLFQLLGLLIETGKDVASVKDVLMGEVPSANVPATTVLALIEQGMQQFTAIYKRVHRSLKHEYMKLYRLNRVYMSNTAGFLDGDVWQDVTPDDFSEDAGVEPISDPTMVSDMQRLARANFLLQFKDDPGFNGLEIRRRVLDAGQIDLPEKLLNTQPPQPDPVLTLEQQQVQITAMKDFHEQARKGERDNYANLKDLTASYLNLANARKAAGEEARAPLDQQLAVLETQINGFTALTGAAGTPGQAQASAGSNAGGGGSQSDPMGAVEAAPAQ